ncbi:hypothetical protein [Nonomuraea sp. NPDC005692]|uniref:hypothetical protein n=1 Tax=Nonomuraea sp. NPDC005692 TaxID=3157168 RepID=UPI0033D0A870
MTTLTAMTAEGASLRLGPGRGTRHGIVLAGRRVTKIVKTPVQLVDVVRCLVSLGTLLALHNRVFAQTGRDV